jgi:hypothetical protein
VAICRARNLSPDEDAICRKLDASYCKTPDMKIIIHNLIFQKRVLSILQKTGVGGHVAKIGSPKTITDHRPIALLSVDYNTFAAVTVNIMGQFLMRIKYLCGKQQSSTQWQPLRTLLHMQR